MASKRWEDIVDKEFGPNFFRPATLTKLRVVKLLASQHAAVVRTITRREAKLREHARRVLKMKRPKHLTKDQWDYVLQLAATLGIGQRLALQHLLAALATHRKGRT